MSLVIAKDGVLWQSHYVKNRDCFGRSYERKLAMTNNEYSGLNHINEQNGLNGVTNYSITQLLSYKGTVSIYCTNLINQVNQKNEYYWY